MRKKIRWPVLAIAALPCLAWYLMDAEAAEGEAHKDWAQWLGPERNGQSRETGLLKAWPAEGPSEVWRIQGGEGFSGISIARGRIYTMFARGDDEFVVCLDAATGKELWRFRSDSNFPDHQGGNGPRSTPAVNGDQVFALSAHGKLYALNAASGTKQWGRDFVRQFGSHTPRWGFSSSPLVEGDLVLAEVGGQGESALVAFDRKNGHQVWSSQSDKPSYSSPIVFTAAGTRQVVFFTAEGPVALAPADGQLLWRYPWRTSYDVNAATPVFIAPDKVFISSGYDTGAALLKIKQGGTKVEKVWRNREMKNQMATSVRHGNHLYGFDDGTLKCIQVGNGETAWGKRGFGRGTLITADGHLLVLGEGGVLALVEATPAEYRERGRVEVLKGKCWTVPSLAGGKLYVRDEHEVVCLEVAASSPAAR